MLDPFNAFCAHTHVALDGSGEGPLVGLTVAVKDVFAIAGYRTGNGHPLWLETHSSAVATASAVQRVLDAGARMVGKTHVDELAYSLNGENIHYGTPINPKAPDRIPGGSSSGSVVAVAGELVDFALATDCGGSVRLPASYCGVYGIRPSHGLVSADGVVPLAPSFDTVGWFARGAALMQRVGDILLPPAKDFTPHRFLVATDMFANVDPNVRSALSGDVARLKSLFSSVLDVNVYADGVADGAATFRILQGSEISANHGPWIDQHHPTFGQGVRDRFQWARTIKASEVARALARRRDIMHFVDTLLGDDALLCLPSAPGPAPMLNTPVEDLDLFRIQALSLLAIAGLTGVPQISIPVAEVNGYPIGLSLIAPRGMDRGLLAWVAANFR